MKQLWRFETGVFLSIWLVLTLASRAWHFGDPGSLWHIVVGQRLLESGTLPRVDPFSFTCAGQPWIAQWWLAEATLAVLHRWGGLDTVALATTTLLAGFFAWIAARLYRNGIHPLLVLLILMLGMAASSYHFHPRPHVVTMVLLAWTFSRLSNVEVGRASPGSLWWLVPVFVLWANAHGGMVGGVVTIAIAGAGWTSARLVRWPSPLKNGAQSLVLVGLTAACALTALATPYGLAMPRVWFALMSSPALPRLIQEHMPLYRCPPEAATVSALGLAYLTMLAGIPMRTWRVTWLLPLLWFALAWTRVRHGPLFAVTAVIAMGDMFPHVRWIAWLARRGSVTCRIADRPPEASATWRGAVIPAVIVTLALVLQGAGVSFPLVGRGWTRLDQRACPMALLPAVRAYAQARPPGTPIFNDMLYGGFLIYFVPELRVFIDDRCELYGDDRLQEYAVAAVLQPEQLENWQRQYGFEAALVPAGSRFDEYLQRAPGWQVAARDATAVFYQRSPRAD